MHASGLECSNVRVAATEFVSTPDIREVCARLREQSLEMSLALSQLAVLSVLLSGWFGRLCNGQDCPVKEGQIHCVAQYSV